MREWKLTGFFKDGYRTVKSIVVEASDDESARKYATILWPDCYNIDIEMLPKGEYIKKEDVLEILYNIKENKDVPKNYGTLLDIIRLVRNLPSEK